MPPKSVIPLRRLKKTFILAALFTSSSNWAAAASTTTSSYFGAGSLDDWLAIGLAALAALFCVQKRE